MGAYLWRYLDAGRRRVFALAYRGRLLMTDFMTTVQLAKYLKVHEATARRFCQRHGFRIGRNWGITRRMATALFYSRKARKRGRRRISGDYARHRAALLERIR